jgi:hypothetical protein
MFTPVTLNDWIDLTERDRAHVMKDSDTFSDYYYYKPQLHSTNESNIQST